MPCSCGSMSCPCGIPCYCLEESCKCPECAIALHPFCKICNKPLITDIQKDENACSCFVGESIPVSILENRNNQQYRMGNIPMPVGYVVKGRFITNMVIPVLPFPQFVPQQSVILRPPSPSMQTDFGNILPSFISDIDAVTPSSVDSGIASTTELCQLEKSRREPTYTGICSTDTQNTDISSRETFSSFFSQSADEKKIANVVQNITTKTEESAIVQEASDFCFPSVGVGNISHPIGFTDSVWRLPNPPFSAAGSPDSNLNLYNPFYVAGPNHTIQTMPTFEKKSCQQASNFYFDSNDLAQKESVTVLKWNKQPSGSTKIEKPNLEIHGASEEFEASFVFATGNKLAFPSSADSKAISVTEPSIETSESYSMHDKKLTAFSTDASCSEGQDLSSAPLEQAASNFSSVKNVCHRNCFVDYNIAKDVSSSEEVSSYREVSKKQSLLAYGGTSNFSSDFQRLFNMRSTENSEENAYPQSSNPSPDFVNNQTNEEIDPIPLYIDASTTRKMEKLLKPLKHSRNGFTFDDAPSSFQNSQGK